MEESRLSDADFQFLQRLIYDLTGIRLYDSKRQMVSGRITRRLRALKLPSFDVYCAQLRKDPTDELPFLIDAITTNVTAFFRHEDQFEFLAETALPDLIKLAQDKRRLRIWSSACSNGSEPYSIAMVICEVVADRRDWDIRILATDIDRNMLAHGQAGEYAEERMAGLSPVRQKRFFERFHEGDVRKYRAAEDLRSMITFKQLNLMQDWPMRGPLDVVFCRNVVIYFDKDTQRVLFSRMAELMRPGGYLFVGASESLLGICDEMEPVQHGVYMRSG